VHYAKLAMLLHRSRVAGVTKNVSLTKTDQRKPGT